MPEGDTLHRAARRLQALVGERIEAEAPHPRGAAVAGYVDGRRLLAARAVGKNLLLEFDGGAVIRSHLRMRGRWSVVRRGSSRVGRPWLDLRGVLAQAARLMRASVNGGRASLAVYRRAGHACRRCGTPIRSRGQGDANRIAYWCPACQP